MKTYTLSVNQSTCQIQIIQGKQVDYSDLIPMEEKDFNNNGVWGKTIKKGDIIKSIRYNPNLTAPNFGASDYSSKLEWMKNELSKLQNQQTA